MGLGTTYSWLSVWQHDLVEINALLVTNLTKATEGIPKRWSRRVWNPPWKPAPVTEGVKKPHHYRPCSIALHEIHKYQLAHRIKREREDPCGAFGTVPSKIWPEFLYFGSFRHTHKFSLTPTRSTLALAAIQISRLYFLCAFERYRGGWDIENHHYWASIGFTGIEHVAGDMFVSIPKGGAIFMKWISISTSKKMA
ncbi:hypothetical protein I3842_08G147900 [Carya illinoinensis]|uniref:Uncharacterized protein n=1 Tax=Carya illinoinensis TaxID=32201 RepID=A0A922EDA2_CARIL|nr:hypothetical protein I3842_08G147900 [Carya illinoinensis]